MCAIIEACSVRSLSEPRIHETYLSQEHDIAMCEKGGLDASAAKI